MNWPPFFNAGGNLLAEKTREGALPAIDCLIRREFDFPKNINERGHQVLVNTV